MKHRDSHFQDLSKESLEKAKESFKDVERPGNKKMDVHFSSKKQDWETPQDFFDKLNEEFKFTMDVCATWENFKVEHFYGYRSPTRFVDGLKEPWYGVCWMNSPYGKELKHWVKKAYEESQKGCTVVALLPARTDTSYFHLYMYQKPNVEIRFVRGRLRFVGAPASAPFPSMIVIFRPTQEDETTDDLLYKATKKLGW